MRAARVIAAMLLFMGCGEPFDAPPDPVTARSAPISNGSSTSFAGVDRNATVRIRNTTSLAACGAAALGTGVLLENDVVLTARHVAAIWTACLAPTPGTGALAPPTSLFVYAQGSIEQPPACTADLCATGRTGGVVFDPSGRDVALIFLNRPIRGYQNDTLGHAVPIYLYDPNRFSGASMFIAGYGASTCNGSPSSTGPLLWGSAINSSTFGDNITFMNSAANQLPLGGDSGSAAWAAGSFPQAAFGVFSSGFGCFSSSYVSPAAYRLWARTEIANRKSPFTYQFGTGTNISPVNWGRDEPSNPSGPSNWSLSGGRLHETTDVHGRVSVPPGIFIPNYPDGSILFPKYEVHESVDVSVNVQSTDNDAAGLVVRYWDATHYYLFAVRQSTNMAHIYKRRGTTFTVLASKPVSVNWSAPGGVNLRFAALDHRVVAWVGSEVLVGPDTQYPVGRVGIYKFALSNASFDNFAVRAMVPSLEGNWPAPSP